MKTSEAQDQLKYALGMALAALTDKEIRYWGRISRYRERQVKQLKAENTEERKQAIRDRRAAQAERRRMHDFHTNRLNEADRDSNR